MIYFTLFYEFFKIGLFCFGGGFGMIPVIEETVMKHEWLTEGQFFDFLGVCESTPGPIAVNLATYIGSVQGGLLGSILATLGVILPSFIIILIIASILKNLTENKYFKAFVKGVKPVVCALIISTGAILLIKLFGYVSPKEFSFDLISVIILVLLLLTTTLYKKITGKKLSSIVLILFSALYGIAVNILA
jgi:chromate transporter